MESKLVLYVNCTNISTVFTKNLQNVKNLMGKELYFVDTLTKIEQ